MIRIEVVNEAAVAADLAAIARKMDSNIAEAEDDSADILAELVRQEAPKVTGELRSAIEAEGNAVAIDHTKAPHANVVRYGGRRGAQAPNAYPERGFRRGARRIDKEIEDAADAAIK